MVYAPLRSSKGDTLKIFNLKYIWELVYWNACHDSPDSTLACICKAPGALHHSMIRGMERRKIFQNNKDREDFFNRLSHLLPETEILRPSLHAQTWFLGLIAIKQSPLFLIWPISSWNQNCWWLKFNYIRFLWEYSFW